MKSKKKTLTPRLEKPFEDLAQVLEDRRAIAGLTRLALAKRVGIADATVKNIEDLIHPPSRKTCLKLYVRGGLQIEWDYFEPFAGPPPTVPKPEDLSGFATLVSSCGSEPQTLTSPALQLRSGLEDQPQVQAIKARGIPRLKPHKVQLRLV